VYTLQSDGVKDLEWLHDIEGIAHPEMTESAEFLSRCQDSPLVSG
jgi:hypothetical protein